MYSSFCNPLNCSPPGSSLCRIPQARILELSFPPPGALPHPGIKPGINPASAAWQAGSLPLSHQEALEVDLLCVKHCAQHLKAPMKT